MVPQRLTRRGTLASAAVLGLACTYGRHARGASGFQFITGSNAAFDTMDPHAVFDIGRIAIRLNMYDAPVRWVDNPPRLEMWLAEKVEISPDGLTYTVSLRPNTRFHNGNVLTSDDVVYSIERILALKRGAYALFKDTLAPGSTKALDNHTVQFNLSRADAVLLAKLSELWVVNTGLLRQNEKSGDYLPFDQIKRLRESGRVNVIERESLRTFYCILNSSKPPMDDVHMRKALSYIFDYDGFNQDILGGSVVRNPGIIPGPMWGAPADLKGYTYDLDQAKAHLAQVKGAIRPLQVGVLAGFPQSEQAGQFLQAGGARIGLDIRVVVEPSFVIQSKMSEPNGPTSFRCGKAAISPIRTTGPAYFTTAARSEGRTRAAIKTTRSMR
jgi:ABC-type transport system substrate-binding protein